MYRKAQFLSLLLCLCLVLSACTGGRGETAATPKESETQQAQTESAAPESSSAEAAASEPGESETPKAESSSETEATPPEPEEDPFADDPLDILTRAYDALARQDCLLSYLYEQDLVICGETLTHRERGSIFVQGAGTDQAVVYEIMERGGGFGEPEYLDYERSYANGIAREERGGAAFYAETDWETFRDWLFDPELVQAELITDYTWNPERRVLEYTVDLGPESLYEPISEEDGAENAFFTGSVIFDENGGIFSEDYWFEYRLGEMTGREYIRVDIEKNTKDVSQLQLPAREDAIRLEDLEIIELMDLASLAIGADSFRTEHSAYILSYAAGAIVLTQETLTWQKNGGAMLRDEVSRSFYTADDTVTSTLDAKYADGILTSDADGTVTTETVAEEDILESIEDFFTDYFPNVNWFSSAELIDENDYWLIRFTYQDEFGEMMQALLSEEVTGDPNLLMSLASEYKTKEFGGYLSIDKGNGLPICSGFSYEGTHRIQGYRYGLEAFGEEQYLPVDPHASSEITEDWQPGEEPQEFLTPLFYHVTGEDGHEMWLLGTIHVGDARTAYLPEELMKAFREADALAVECDTDQMEAEDNDEIMEIYFEASLYDDDSTAYDHLSEENAAALEQALMAYGGHFTFELMNYKVSVASSTLENDYQSLGRSLSSECGVDERLMKLAKDSGKEVLEVESLEFQIRMINGFPERWQEIELESTLETGHYAYNYQLAQLFELWCSGNEEELTQVLAAEEDTADWTEEEIELYGIYNKAMMLDRNAGMIETAKEYLSGEKTVFFAVGLAHLLGEKGIVKGLRDAGYTVELVSFAR